MRESTKDKARLVEIMSFSGMPTSEIARHIGVCERTVKKLRRCEAARQERARLREELVKQAMAIRMEHFDCDTLRSPTYQRMQKDLFQMQHGLSKIKNRR